MSGGEHEEQPLRRELLAVLAHELRSPLGAILNWEELLSEGICGSVDQEARAALGRMRGAALQLLHLVGGMSDLAQRDRDALVEPGVLDARTLLTEADAALRFEAEPRDTHLELSIADDLPPMRSDPERAGRALQLALGAAIKSTPAGRILVAARASRDGLAVDISGSLLDIVRDDPDAGSSRPSGPGLRIAMARRTLASIRGTLELAPAPEGCTVRLHLRPLPD